MLKLKNIFLKSPSNAMFWLLSGFIFKGILFFAVILNHPYRDIPGIWGATQADDSSYLVPIDHLLQHGIYSPDFRMPGYGAAYFIFRLLFTPTGACNCLIVLQLILASVNVYFLALTSLNVFKNKFIFYITFYVYLFCSYSNFFDAYICTESLATSLLIFSVYFFTRYFQEYKINYLLYAGVLATWSMFVRPVFGGLSTAFCLIILLQNKLSFGVRIKQVFLFLIPFVVCEGSWIIRNFKVHGKFIPFTTTGEFYPNSATSYLQPLFEFAQSWGGVCSLTRVSVDVNWFQYHYPGLKPIIHYDSLPDNIYTSEFNKDSLLRLKQMILKLQDPTIDTTTASVYQHELRMKLDKYTLSEKKEKPFVYFVEAPLKMVGVILYGPITRLYLDRGKSVPFIGKFITDYNYVLYLIIIFSGLTGAIMLIIAGLKQSYLLLIIPFIPLYTILIHPFMFRFFDNRFLMPSFPFLIICACYCIHNLFTRASRKAERVN